MSTRARWNPKIFALLLEKAKGVRSWRQFASDCGISYVQMRKLSSAAQENPPRPKLLRRLASNSFGDIDLEDYLFAAGMNQSPGPVAEKEEPAEEKRLRSLKKRDRDVVRALIDILYEQSRPDGPSD